MLDLQILWDDLARRHKSAPGQPKPSGFQLFNRVADDLARTLVERERHPSRQELLNHPTNRSAMYSSICGDCGIRGLQHFFTSWRTGGTLCARCLQERMAGPGNLLKQDRERRKGSR